MPDGTEGPEEGPLAVIEECLFSWPGMDLIFNQFVNLNY